MVDPLSVNIGKLDTTCFSFKPVGVRCSSMVRVFTHGAMGRRIDQGFFFMHHPTDRIAHTMAFVMYI